MTDASKEFENFKVLRKHLSPTAVDPVKQAIYIPTDTLDVSNTSLIENSSQGEIFHLWTRVDAGNLNRSVDWSFLTIYRNTVDIITPKGIQRRKVGICMFPMVDFDPRTQRRFVSPNRKISVTTASILTHLEGHPVPKPGFGISYFSRKWIRSGFTIDEDKFSVDMAGCKALLRAIIESGEIPTNLPINAPLWDKTSGKTRPNGRNILCEPADPILLVHKAPKGLSDKDNRETLFSILFSPSIHSDFRKVYRTINRAKIRNPLSQGPDLLNYIEKGHHIENMWALLSLENKHLVDKRSFPDALPADPG